MASPNAVTLQQLITNAQSLSDMLNSTFVSTSEWTVWANKGYSKLYDLLIASYGVNWQFALPIQFITNSGQMFYPLPDGVTQTYYTPGLNGSAAQSGFLAPAFYKLLGADICYNGGLGADPNTFITMYPFQFGDRNRANGVLGVASRGFTRGNDYRYRLQGQNSFWLTPKPQAGFTIQVWYAPRLTPLVNLTDTLEGVSGWEEIIELDMAIKALVKEESDPSALIAARNETVQRIINMAATVDAGAPESVRDVYGPMSGNSNAGGGYSSFGMGMFGIYG
jgi:hypothetical protein